MQTDHQKVAGLVVLPQYLQRETIENKRNRESFETLLRLLREVFSKATSSEVLANVSGSLAHLLQHDTDRLHNVAAVIQSLVEDLQKRLAHPTSQGEASSSSRGASRRSKEQDEDFLAGLVLLQLASLAKQMDIGEYVDMQALAGNVRSTLEARMDVDAWKNDEERLRLTVRVIREAVQVLFVFLLRSTATLFRAVSERYPAAKPKKAKKGKKAGEEEEAAEEDEEEEEGEAEEEVEGADDPDLLAQADALVEQKKALLEVLSGVLRLETPEGGTSADDGSYDERRSRRPRAITDAAQEVKKIAYSIVSDMRFLFRHSFGNYRVSE